MAKRSKKQLQNELQQVVLLLQQEKFEAALERLPTLAPQLHVSDGYRVWAHVLQSLGRDDEAVEVILAGAEKWQTDHELNVHAGAVYYERGDYERALAAFSHAFRTVRAEPELLARHAHCLLDAGRAHEARKHALDAFQRKSRGTPALIHGLLSLHAGDFDAAEDALLRASNSLEDAARDSADGLLALTQFWKGDVDAALERFRTLEVRGGLDDASVPYYAMAAAARGDEAKARELVERMANVSGPESALARARVELALNHPDRALEALDAIGEPPEGLAPLVAAIRGRALRQVGRTEEAEAVLTPLIDKTQGVIGAMALTDLGRIASDAGEHEKAAERFEAALKRDPGSAEAAKGLELARSRTAWREAVARDAESRIEQARSEAEAMRRAFAERERELELLKAKLAQLEKSASEAEREARAAREEAEKARQASISRELETREREAEEKAQVVLQEAFGEVWDRCPAPLQDALRVAEVTYQKALYTELHPAAIAVLYAGALERGLYQLFVQPFDRSLTPERRAEFLKAATRELRPGRVEYTERFVEAFDPERKARAPSLGELARAIAKRDEPQLRMFGEFVAQRFDLPTSFFDALAAEISTAKEQLRDPVAHGRALALPQSELTRFRKALLFEFADTGTGALPALVRAMRD